MCGWIGAVADLVAPVVEHLKQDLLGPDLIGTDDTVVPVLDPGQKVTAKGRLWVYVGDDDHPAVVFDYTPTRERDGPDTFLQGYSGYLQADAYSGYDGIYRAAWASATPWESCSIPPSPTAAAVRARSDGAVPSGRCPGPTPQRSSRP